MTSAKQWWRRAAALAKDKRSLCLSRVSCVRSRPAEGGPWSPELQAAVIRATNHDERSLDYASAGRVFAWARAAPSFLDPLMWALARRAARTRSWAVALKTLLLTHGLLLSPHRSPSTAGRLPFDLSEFCDRSPDARGFSAFVRAYFQFLDHRSILLAAAADAADNLTRVDCLQVLLDLLLQVRPYAHGAAVGLVLEAMDCAVIEIFEVYSAICNGVASLLVSILGSSSAQPEAENETEEEKEGWRRRGEAAIRILRRAGEQSARLSSYFDACRALGVLNTAELPPIERIPDEDVLDLERLVLAGVIPGKDETSLDLIAREKGAEREERKDGGGVEGEFQPATGVHSSAGTVVTKDWVVFEDEPVIKGVDHVRYRNGGYYGTNPFLDASQPSDRLWEVVLHHPSRINNLIELM